MCETIFIVFDIIGKVITSKILICKKSLRFNNLSTQMSSESKILVFCVILKIMNLLFELQ